MASLRGIVESFVVILFCTDLFCAAEEDSRERISVPESEHFCAKVMSGHFKRIQLVYINQDIIFEPSYHVLYVSGLDENHTMTLNDTYFEVNDRMDLSGLALVQGWLQNNSQVAEPIRRLYLFVFGEDRVDTATRIGFKWAINSAIRQAKLIYLVFTDSAQYALDVWPAYSFNEPVELLSEQAISSDTPEFALLYKHKDEDTATGYVIEKDTFTHTDNFIIYDFTFSTRCKSRSSIWTNLASFVVPIQLINMFKKLCSSKSSKPEERDVFYFIEKTDNPHEIRLIHRDHPDANGSSADRHLFRDALPNGFQYNGSQYLFDGSLGCVYVIQEFEFSLTQQFKAGKVDFRLKRLNIPYEQYFKCPDKYKLTDDFAKRYRADRCDSVIGEDDGSIDRVEPIEHSKSTGLNWTLIGLVCLLFMAALVVVVVVFWKKAKTRKIDKKKRPIGPNDLESASKSNKTLTTSGTKSKKSSSSGSSTTL